MKPRCNKTILSENVSLRHVPSQQESLIFSSQKCVTSPKKASFWQKSATSLRKASRFAKNSVTAQKIASLRKNRHFTKNSVPLYFFVYLFVSLLQNSLLN